MRYSNEIIILRPRGVKVKQVNKRAARNAYNDGKNVYLNACLIAINNPWTSPCRINKNNTFCQGNTFDAHVNEFQWYNCNAETGKYANFFVEVD